MEWVTSSRPTVLLPGFQDGLVLQKGGQQAREPAGLKPGAPQASDLPHRVLPQICVEGMEKGGRGLFRFPGPAALWVSFLKTESPMAQHPSGGLDLGPWLFMGQ